MYLCFVLSISSFIHYTDRITHFFSSQKVNSIPARCIDKNFEVVTNIFIHGGIIEYSAVQAGVDLWRTQQHHLDRIMDRRREQPIQSIAQVQNP